MKPDTVDIPSGMGRLGPESGNILFVSDMNLGQGRGWRLFSSYFPNARRMIWSQGSSREAIRHEIRQGNWLLTISFYNDFIFQPGDFPHLGMVLNFHPALPSIRGVGHDHIPLIESHDVHGGTLHFIEPPPAGAIEPETMIDTGRIIRVSERQLPANSTCGDIRAANQEIMLEMLARLCRQMHEWGSLERARAELLMEADANDLGWDKRYVSRCGLRKLLDELSLRQPGHRALVAGLGACQN